MPETRPLDGKNIWPALRDNTASPVESYYWAWRNEDAIRTADWRLHRFFDHFELYDIRNDIGEAKNVADAHPDVVKSLTAKMNAWAESLGAALTHQPAPAKLDAKPAPEGEVLEVTVTVTRQGEAEGPAGRSHSPRSKAMQFATDYIEYDIAVRAGQPASAASTTRPSKATTTSRCTLDFKRGEGIDQFGREQVHRPEIQGGAGRVGTSRHRPVQQCARHPAAARPRLQRRQARHLQGLPRQPPHPPRRRQHHADLDQRQGHALSQDRRQRVVHQRPSARRAGF